jgi:signal transduction histidine kinase
MRVTFNPLRTLAGRLVLVTIAAIAISHIVAFFLFANERMHSFRREAEQSAVERIVDVADRVRDLPPESQALTARAASNRAMRFSIVSETETGVDGGAASRIARAVASQLDGADVNAHSREVEVDWRRRMHRLSERYGVRDRDGGPPRRIDPERDTRRRVTEATVDVPLGPGRWLRTRAYLPAPRPAPTNLWIAALASMLAVGIGAALISRQIGRPLADLARAADKLGWGDTHVAAPVSGPEDVRRASTAFNAMAERLSRQLSRQRQMLWALSHDLRTPITALRLRAELIEDDAARQRLLAPLAEMEALTEQALALARAGASEEQRAKVDLAEIARTLCGELQDIGVNARADANEAVIAECRPSEIARAIRNLVENAAKYGGEGVVKVYRGPRAEAIVEVSDEGPGLPDDLIARVTEPFFRADSARSQGNGAGLGLAIAQAIADGHGGRLVLKNRVPHGLSAQLILPG